MTFISKINEGKKASKKILIITLTLMSIFSLLGCIYNVDAAWATTKMVNTGMTGWFDSNGIYHSVSERFHTTVSNKMSINIGNYDAVCVLTHARDDNSELELYNPDGNIMREFTDENGETKYYQWYTKTYHFDFMCYTQARAVDVMPLVKSETKSAKWLDYYYNDAISPNPISIIKKYKFGYQDAYIDYSGYIYDGNPTQLADENQARMDIEIAIALGDSFTFPGTIIPDGADGQYTFGGTSYFIQDIRTLTAEDENSYTSTGLVEKEILSNPSIQATIDSEENPSEVEETEVNGENIYENGDMSSLPISSVGKGKLVSVNPHVSCTAREMGSSGGYLQTLPAHSENLALETANNIPISKNFQPDAAILPQPLTECYFTLPVDMTPLINYETVNVEYNSYEMVVRKHFSGLFKRQDFIDEFNKYSHLDKQDYVVYREVQNVYYIQSFELTMCVASIYDWVPDSQEAEVPVVPTQTEIPEILPDPDIGGELQFDSYHPDTNLLDAIFGWGSEDFFRIATVVCISIALVLLILFLRSFNKAKILKDDTRLLKEASMRTQQYLGMPGFSQYMPQTAPMMQMTPSTPMNNGYQMQQPINQGFNAQSPPGIQTPYGQQPQKVNSNATDTEKVIESKNLNQTLPESSVVLAVESKASTRNTLTALTIGISIGIIVFLTLFNFLK